MNKLMTKFTFTVEVVDRVATTTVTRLKDGAVKVFTNVGHSDDRALTYFMNSITDDLAESYFPREKNKKRK